MYKTFEGTVYELFKLLISKFAVTNSDNTMLLLCWHEVWCSEESYTLLLAECHCFLGLLLRKLKCCHEERVEVALLLSPCSQLVAPYICNLLPSHIN